MIEYSYEGQKRVRTTPNQPSREGDGKWQARAVGISKMNVDGAIFPKLRYSGIGSVIRDANG